MDLTCEKGPERKQEPAREMRLPIVYMTAKGSGWPVRSLVKRKKEPNSRIIPTRKQHKQPKRRCCQVKVGHHQHISSSRRSQKVLGRASTPSRRRALSIKLEEDEVAKAAGPLEDEELAPGPKPLSKFICPLTKIGRVS